MARLQLALNVQDIDTATHFYTQLFNTEPAKHRPGYANFEIAEPPLKLVLFENPKAASKLNHLGIEVESSDKVWIERDRLREANLSVRSDEQNTCCYALQDKAWVTDPDGDAWEIYTVLKDADTFSCGPNCA